MEIDNNTFAVGDMEQFKHQVEEVSQSFEKLAGKIKLAGVEMNRIEELGEEIGKAQVHFQNLEKSLSHYLGSAEEAKQVTAELLQFLAWSPFEVEDITECSIALAAYGADAGSITDTLMLLGDIATGLSVPLQELVHLLGAVINEGKLSSETLEGFAARGVPLMQELAANLGLSEVRITSFAQSGGVGLQDVLRALNNLTRQGGVFYNAMVGQSARLIEQLQEMRDAWASLAVSIKDASLNNVAKDTGNVVDKFKLLDNIISAVATTSGSLNSIVSAISTAETLGKSITGLTGTASLASKALSGLGIAAKGNVYLMIAAEIGKMALELYKLYDAYMLTVSPTRRLKESTDEYNKSLEVERSNIDILFNRLRNAKVGTDEWKDAKNAIMNTYGNYLKGLGDEVRLLWDVEGAYKAISEAAIEAAKNRAMEKAATKAGDIYTDTWSKNIIEIQEKFVEKFGKDNGQQLFERLRDALGNNQEFDDEVKKAIKSFDTGRYIPSSDGVGGIKVEKKTVNDIDPLIEDVRKGQRTYNNEIEGLKSVYGPIKAETPLDPLTASLEKLHLALPKAKAELQDLLNTEGSDEKTISKKQDDITAIETAIEKQRDELTQIKGIYDEIFRINQQIELLDGGKDDPARAGLIKKRDELESRLPQLGGETAAEKLDRAIRYSEMEERHAQESKRKLQDLHNKTEQEDINTQQEGYAKKQAQMKLNHAMEMQQLEREKEDYLNQKRDTARTLFEQNPNKKGVFNPSSIVLDEDELKAFADREGKLKTKHSQEQANYVNEMKRMQDEVSAHHRSALERRLKDIENNYTKQIEAAAGNEELIAALKKSQQIETDKAVREEAQRIIDFNLDIFRRKVDIENKFYFFKSDLRKKILEAERDALEKQEELLKSQYDENATEELAEELERIGVAIKKVNKELDEIPVNKVQELLSTFSTVFRELGGLDGEVGDFFNNMADAVDSVMASLDNEKQGFSVERIQQAVKGVVQVVNMLTDASQKRKEAEREFYQNAVAFAHEYALALNECLRMQSELSESGFVTDYQGRIDDGFAALTDATNNYQDALSKLSDGKVKIDLRDAISWSNVGKGALGGLVTGAAIGSSIAGPIGAAIGGAIGAIGGALAGLLGGGKKKNKYGGLLEIFPELVDGVGNLNRELATSLINTNQLDDKTKQLLQNALDWADAMEKANEQIIDIVVDLAGDLGNNIRDSLVEAFKAGEDASTKMFEVASKSLEKFIENLLFSIVFKEAFEEFEKNATEALKGNGDMLLVYDNLIDDIQSGTDIYFSSLDSLKRRAEEKGLELWNDNEAYNNQQASSRGFTSMSQDTGNELNGRFTSLQMSGIQLEQFALARNDMLNGISIDTATMNTNIGLIGMSVDEIRDINRQSMNHLYKIEKNTSLLHNTNELLNKVVSNTANL